MNHLEQLISEWLEFKGYFVRNNVKVGPLKHGGHEGELDVVAYDPKTNRILHIEPSMDSHTWTKRETRFKKKFAAGTKYIFPQVFPSLDKNTKIEQWAVIMGSDSAHKTLGGGTVYTVPRIYEMIANDLKHKAEKEGWPKAIPEQYMLLRTMQHTLRWTVPR
jgi:hypothetical protein